MDLFNTDQFTNRVNDLLEEWHIPGLAVAIVQDDKINSRGFGKACLDPPKPVTADTIFDIASCSKSLTAASVALLVEDDENYPEVKWDAKMSALLPADFVMSEDSYTKDVTVEDILSHRTGLPGHDFSYKHSDTPRSVTRNLRNLQISEPIRTKEQYCNLMYTVATHLIETKTKDSFTNFLKTRIWTPLGMTSTNLEPESAIAAGLQDRIFTPYRWDRDEKQYVAAELQQIPEAQGAGSVYTCVNDYILWIQAMMNRSHPVTEAVYAGMTKPRIVTNPDTSLTDFEPLTSHTMYAAGLDMQFYRGRQILSHFGGDPGIGAYLFFAPGIKLGGVLFGNSHIAGEVAHLLSRELIDAALGVPEAERCDWNARLRKDDDEYQAKKDEGWKKMLGIAPDEQMPESEPQTRALDLYVGTYNNIGYHEIVVEIKDERLFIDATDRTMGFYLRLEHFKDQEKYVAYVKDYYDGAKRKTAVKFRFGEDGEGKKAVSIGVDLEEDVGDFIWFDIVEG